MNKQKMVYKIGGNLKKTINFLKEGFTVVGAEL